MLVPDEFVQVMRRAGRPVRVAPTPVRPRERVAVLLAGARARVAELGEDCVGVRGEDLADILEILYTVGDCLSWPEDALDALRRSRRQTRGGYGRVLTWDPADEGDT
jgi:predicted house-cleaning noncanonical NTP pyrophosphatase (MazG superfamily)